MKFRIPTFRDRKGSRGQSIVEFALILPVLVLLLLITLDFGRLFMSYITLTNTTRVAANFGSTSTGPINRLAGVRPSVGQDVDLTARALAGNAAGPMRRADERSGYAVTHRFKRP